MKPVGCTYIVFIHLYIYRSTIYVCIYLSIYLHIYLSIYHLWSTIYPQLLSNYLSTYTYIYRSTIYPELLSIYLSIYIYIYPSIDLPSIPRFYQSFDNIYWLISDISDVDIWSIYSTHRIFVLMYDTIYLHHYNRRSAKRNFNSSPIPSLWGEQQ